MKKTNLFILILLVPIVAFGQLSDRAQQVARQHIEALLRDAGDDKKVDLYATSDVDGDGEEDLVLASFDFKHIKAYSLIDDKAVPKPIELTNQQLEVLKDTEKMSYGTLFFILQDLQLDADDHINKLEPIILWRANFSKNKFSRGLDGSENTTTGLQKFERYTKMVFKPHVGDVVFTGKVPSESEYYDHDIVWKMKDPEFIKTEFRGYTPEEVSPIIFKADFRDYIGLLNFSRWRKGEPVSKVSQDIKDLISQYYGGETIIGIRYVADCKVYDRQWYRVVFKRNGYMSHYALVAILEGRVVAVWDEYVDLQAHGASASDVWYGGSLSEFWDWKQTEFMAMWTSKKGLEILLRWPSLEGFHYSIVREVGGKLVAAIDDYQYLMAY